MPDANALLTEKIRTFRGLHSGPTMLVMLNAWDAASARAFERAGYPAIATTSGGVAASLGYGDHENAPADEMFAAAARIARAVSAPVTADLEAGYGLHAPDLVQRAIAAGVVGMNIEDTDHRSSTLVDAHAHAERIAAIRSAARSEGADLFVNARVDVFLRDGGDPHERLAEAIRRARLYAGAGAECVYPFGMPEDLVDSFVRAVGVPVNMRAGANAPSLERLGQLGVRRVTYASGSFRRALAMVDAMAAELRADLR